MLLRVENLRTHLDTPAGVLRAVDGVSFDLPAGQTLALVGESGCGKTLTALSLLRLLPRVARVVSGHAWLDGEDLLALPPAALRGVRGRRAAVVFQEPMTSLNPLLTIGVQIEEPLRLHLRLSGRAARARAVELLRRVGLPDPEHRAREFPHQLSGGMRQRVLIAMALACEPRLLIADEPTTALDVTVQAQILALLRKLQDESGLGLLFITHDLALVAQIAQHVAVMYAGRVVERGPTERLLTSPRHPYTQGLLRSTPRFPEAVEAAAGPVVDAAAGAAGAVAEGSAGDTGGVGRGRLPAIPGDVPDLRALPTGCAFHPRCAAANGDERCRSRVPPLVELPGHGACACWRAPGYAEALSAVAGSA